jgi:hypothetical protein
MPISSMYVEHFEADLVHEALFALIDTGSRSAG